MTEPCWDYEWCDCASRSDGHCMYCLRPAHEHPRVARFLDWWWRRGARPYFAYHVVRGIWVRRHLKEKR